MLVDGLGCWLSQREKRIVAPGTSALFFDRDNVLLDDPGYLHCPLKVRLLEGAANAVRWANAHSLPAILVTNQSGIARGLFGWDEFHAVNDRMDELLGKAGARLDAVVACAWHEDGLAPLSYRDHPWRKPNPGMFLASAEAIGCDLASSWMIGDRQTDIEAAYNAGLCGGIWVGQNDNPDQLWLRENGADPFEVVTAQAATHLEQILIDKFHTAALSRSSADAL